MKRFLTILLVLVVGVQVCTPTLAQEADDFDIWDFATHPTVVNYDLTTPLTHAIVIANATRGIPELVMEEIDNYVPMVAVKLALMAHVPSTNAATQALLSSAIPTGDTAVKEIRYLAAFKAEVRREYASLVPVLIQSANNRLDTTRLSEFWYWGIWRYQFKSIISQWMLANHKRALKVADIMSYCDTRNMTNVAIDFEWIRDSARVQLGELGGFTLTGGSKPIHLTTRLGQTQRVYTAGSIMKANAIYRLSEEQGGIGTATIVAGDAPVKFSIGTSGETTLAASGTRIFSDRELINGISIRTVAPPTTTQTINPQSTQVGDSQTTNFVAFTGEDIVYSVSSSDSAIVNARLSASPNIIVLSALKVGTATVTLTATNGAGSASVTFDVVVTSGTGDRQGAGE